MFSSIGLRNEVSCVESFVRTRWPDGFRCPRCKKVEKAWKTSRGLMHCSMCGHQTSITAGTCLHGSRQSLSEWFRFLKWALSSRTEITVEGIKAGFKVQNDGGARGWLKRYQSVVNAASSVPLSGLVEIHEAAIPYPFRLYEPESYLEQAMIVSAIEIEFDVPSRIAMNTVDNVKAESLLAFISRYVVKGSTIVTSGRRGYSSLSTHQYKHININQATCHSKYNEMWIQNSTNLTKDFVEWTIMFTKKNRALKGKLQELLKEYSVRYNNGQIVYDETILLELTLKRLFSNNG